MNFTELSSSVRPEIVRATQAMGYTEMTEIQQKAIPLMLAGHDMIAKAPTGTGKTVAFGIPILQKAAGFPAGAPKAVVLSPTRELAQQIAQDLTNLAQFLPEIRVVCVYGGAGLEKQQKQLKAGCQIVVATPGRLMDHYRHHALDLSQVTTIVLDEADEMLNMGFYKDVRGIIDLLKSRESLSMFSATISREVLDIGWLYQHNAAEVDVQPVQESSPKIAQYKLLTTGRDKLADLAQIIISKDYKRVMVFCNTKYNTGMLANQLARLHFNVDCLHGDLSQAERNRIMQRFKAGEINVLVATDVAARGIDVSDVDAVINYDVPEENEHYTHRIGRTGRAKREGASYLFYTKDEQKRVDTLLRLTRNTDDCRSVHFDFNHEKLVVEEKQNVDKFNIKCYF
jgi:ATP-dependent RNA helicase DeaD